MTSLPISRITVRAEAIASPRATHRFYIGIALAVLITVFSGFAPSFYLRPPTAFALSRRAVLHGTLFSSWVALFAIQIGFVAAGNVRLHRKLGVAAVALALAMVVSAPPMAIAAAGRGVFPGDSLEFLLVMLVDLFLFATFVGAAIYYRRRAELHKRLMVLGMVSMLPPAIGRWPIAVRHVAIIPVVLFVFLVATPVFDYLARRRMHRVSIYGGIAIVISIPVRFAIAHTAAWHHVASWLVR